MSQHTRIVYTNGPQELNQELKPEAVFIGHTFFGSDALKRADYRLPFVDALTHAGFRPLFPDEVAHPGALLSSISQHIFDAGGCIFDLTHFSANVLIELGLSLALNRPVLSVLDAGIGDCPSFLEELDPLRYETPVRLSKSVVNALESRLEAAALGQLDDRYCSICQRSCPSRSFRVQPSDAYIVVDLESEENELLRYNIDETLKSFRVIPLESVPTGNLCICRWLSLLQNAHFVIFCLRSSYDANERATIFLQLGLAIGLGVPWTMILPHNDKAPADLQGLMHVAVDESWLLFRSALSKTVKGLLLSERRGSRFGGLEHTPSLAAPSEDIEDMESEDEALPLHDTLDNNSMNDKFEKFTERARRVLTLAQEEAQRFNHNYIGTEHLLLGLSRERDGVAAAVLTDLGIDLGKLRSAVEFIIGRGDRIVLGEIGLTPRSKKVIELAVDEARRLNQHYIGTEHILLGLVREREGIGAGVLASLGVNLEKVRKKTVARLAASREELHVVEERKNEIGLLRLWLLRLRLRNVNKD